MDQYDRCYVHVRSGRLAGSFVRRSTFCGPSNVTPAALGVFRRKSFVNLKHDKKSLDAVLAKRQCKVVVKNPRHVQEIFDNLSAGAAVVERRQSSIPLPKLRKRKVQDYAEISINEEPQENLKVTENHVPIYRQLGKDKVETETLDLYEFDSDSEKVKAKRRRKNSMDSIGFDNHMTAAVKAIENNFKRNMARRRQRLIKRNAIVYKKTQVSKNDTKNQPPRERSVQTEKVTVPEDKSMLVTNNNITKNQSPKERSVQKEKVTASENKSMLVTNNIITKNQSPNERSAQTEKVTVSENKSMPVTSNNTQINECDESEEIICDESNEYFGFTNESSDSEEFPKGSRTNRITIISNVIIAPNSESNRNGTCDDLMQPNANSTMLLRRKKLATSSPWRPSFGKTRNPHFLQIKETMLPNYDQDMIIDSSIGENSVTNKSMLRTTQKMQHQSSILDYIDSNKETNDRGDVSQNCSLFDAGDFSPIKSVIARTNENTKNVSRNLLGPQINNTLVANRVALSPLQNITHHNIVSSSVREHDDIEDYFGFDRSSEDKENAKVVRRKPVAASNTYFKKPVRFDGFVKTAAALDKKVQNRDYEKIAKTNAVRVDENTTPPELENDEVNVRLFEDLVDDVENDQRTMMRKYERKRVRRQRQMSFVSNSSDDEDDHRKHKNKFALTPQEAKEYERWAAAFNSMCCEVDQHVLEID